jgi:uncharacterized protein YndB with AHSA1/START domain
MPNTNDTSTREIITTRMFNAPCALVFDAWTSPAHLSRWWGPNGFSTTTHAFHFRVGGQWLMTMHGPDGTDFPSRMVYDAIVPNERIVYSHHGHFDGAPALFQQTVTFTARGDQTEVTMHTVFPSKEARDTVVEKFGAIEGAKQTLSRLGEHVASGAQVPNELRLSRVFNAPPHLVFRAWSSAEHFQRWFAPRPMTLSHCKLDFRAGGAMQFTMRMPDGTEYPFAGRFEEVVENERIVFSGDIHDGNRAHTTVTFLATNGKTTLNVHQTYTVASDATRGAYAGWSSTLDNLAAELKEHAL